MKKEMVTITPTIENMVSGIDEEKLPQVLKAQVALLKEVNQKLALAEEKERTAHEKVAQALANADNLIKGAKNIGKQAPEKSKFLWWEWTSKKADIDALKKNLQEIIKHGSDSAEAQKNLVNVQSALLESQTSILEVQKANMEYQRQIADVTKFVFGLSAYNMAISESIYINLEAILANESPEKMGELAQQQLFLVLDQIKNQENLITRIRESEDLIAGLNEDIQIKQAEIEKLNRLEEEQDRRIHENAQDIDELERRDEEHDKRLDEGDKRDAEQDAQITENAQDIDELERRDEEQDKRLDEGDKRDAEQDAQISENAQDIDELERQDAEQDKLIAEVVKKDKEQDESIESLLKKAKEQDLKIAEMMSKIQMLDALALKQKKMIWAVYAGAGVGLISAIISLLI